MTSQAGWRGLGLPWALDSTRARVLGVGFGFGTEEEKSVLPRAWSWDPQQWLLPLGWRTEGSWVGRWATEWDARNWEVPPRFISCQSLDGFFWRRERWWSGHSLLKHNTYAKGSPRMSLERRKTPPSSSTCSPRPVWARAPVLFLGEDAGLLVSVGTFQLPLGSVTWPQPWWGPGHRQHRLLPRSAGPGCSWYSSAPPGTPHGDLDGRHKQFMVQMMGKRSRWYLQPTWPVSSLWTKAGCNFTIKLLGNPRIKRKIHP